jgi:hypothetical protein
LLNGFGWLPLMDFNTYSGEVKQLAEILLPVFWQLKKEQE